MDNFQENVYKIFWQPGTDFAALKSDLGRPRETPQRYVTISVQKERICLTLDQKGVPSFVPYVHEEGAWRSVYARNVKVEDVTEHMLENEDTLGHALYHQMLLQFRDSVCGYYTDYPTMDEIMAVLDNDPRMSAMCRERYIFYEVSVEDDPEWDGAYSVFCAKGHILIPYITRDAGEQDDPRLLTQHATFVPESGISNMADKASGLFGRIGDLFRNLHWSNVRQTLNGVWR